MNNDANLIYLYYQVIHTYYFVKQTCKQTTFEAFVGTLGISTWIPIFHHRCSDIFRENSNRLPRSKSRAITRPSFDSHLLRIFVFLFWRKARPTRVCEEVQWLWQPQANSTWTSHRRGGPEASIASKSWSKLAKAHMGWCSLISHHGHFLLFHFYFQSLIIFYSFFFHLFVEVWSRLLWLFIYRVFYVETELELLCGVIQPCSFIREI